METSPSFAPLAARLSAQAAELRPVEGSRDTWAKFAALVMCLLLDMLICLCEALDARAVTGVRLAPTARDAVAATTPAPRAGRLSLPGGMRVPSSSLAPEVQAVTPTQAKRTNATHSDRSLSWSLDRGPLGAVSAFLAVPAKNAAFSLASRHVHFVTI